MKIHGAIIKDRGQIFAIIIVKTFVINSRFKANEIIETLQNEFSNIPIILMAHDYRGRPTYYGRYDIVNFLKNIPVECIPWKEFNVRVC